MYNKIFNMKHCVFSYTNFLVETPNRTQISVSYIFTTKHKGAYEIDTKWIVR